MIRDGSLKIIHGKADPKALTVFSVVRNEMFFLPAFLDYYRRKGIAQFVFVDDCSSDGTLEYLRNQSDCAVMRSAVRFGSDIEGMRAVHVWRNTVPHMFFPGKWAVSADADEFLQLPTGFESFPAFIRKLDAERVEAVGAVMIDHYPPGVREFREKAAPASAAELFARYPWFDRGPYVRWAKGEKRPVVLHGGVRERLFRQYGISTRSLSKPSWTVLQRRVRRYFGGDRNIRSIHKVPLVKWREGLFYEHSHTLNVPPADGILLALSHFKFTAVLNEKIEHAVSTGGYADNSRLYHGYKQVLERMGESTDGFLGPLSMKYEGPQSYETAELMWCRAKIAEVAS